MDNYNTHCVLCAEAFSTSHVAFFMSELISGFECDPIDVPHSTIGCCFTCYVTTVQSAKFDGEVKNVCPLSLLFHFN